MHTSQMVHLPRALKCLARPNRPRNVRGSPRVILNWNHQVQPKVNTLPVSSAFPSLQGTSDASFMLIPPRSCLKASHPKTSPRTRRSSRLSMSVSTGATSRILLHSHAPMKPYGEDSSPPATPTPIVMSACPDMRRTSSPVPGGVAVPSPLGFGFAPQGGCTKSVQGEAIGESFATLLTPGGWLI